VTAWTFTYDANGNPLSRTDALGDTWTSTYDNLDRQVTAKSFPNGTSSAADTTTYGYDLNGNVTSVTDGLGHVTSYTYDSENRLVSETDPSGGGTTTYAYDTLGRLASVTDPESNVTSYSYDDGDRVTAETDPLGHVTEYFYDLVGNLTRTIDRNGQETDYAYDADNRVTTETWVNPAGDTPLDVFSTTYDAAGRVTGVSDANSSYAFTYDTANRLQTVDNSGTPDVPHVVLTYGYDAAGNRTSLSDSLGGSNLSTYDEWNELTSLAQSGTGVSAKAVTFGYDAAARLISLNRFANAALDGTGAVVGTSYSYDQAGRLTSIAHTLPDSTVVSSYAYTLDAADRLTAETRTWADGSSSDTTDYTYTTNNQLTGVTHTDTSFANESFSYDANGNRTTTGYSTGTGNELMSDGTYDYTYDADGNMITQTDIATSDETIYTYDYRNRLTEVDQVVGVVTSVLAQYTYDALDRRIGVTEGGSTTWTVYDGTSSEPLLDFNGSGDVTARYLNGPSPAGVDAVLARDTPSGGVAWYLADRLGSVEDLVDNSGAVIDHIDYTAFGTPTQTNSSEGDRFEFAGMQYDAVIGQYCDEARWYSPSDGRFLRQDPDDFNARDSNLYRYGQNSPTNSVDPTGTQVSGGPFTSPGYSPAWRSDLPNPPRPRPPSIPTGRRKPTPPYFNLFGPGDYFVPGYLQVSPSFKPCGGSWSWIPEYDHNDPKNPFLLPTPGTKGNFGDALQTPAGVLKIPGGVTVVLVGCESDGSPIFWSNGDTIWYPESGGNPWGDNPNTLQTEPWDSGPGQIINPPFSPNSLVGVPIVVPDPANDGNP